MSYRVVIGMKFIDRFIRDISQAEMKFAPWNSQPIAMIPRKPRDTEVMVINSKTNEEKKLNKSSRMHDKILQIVWHTKSS